MGISQTLSNCKFAPLDFIHSKAVLGFIFPTHSIFMFRINLNYLDALNPTSMPGSFYCYQDRQIGRPLIRKVPGKGVHRFTNYFTLPLGLKGVFFAGKRKGLFGGSAYFVGEITLVPIAIISSD